MLGYIPDAKTEGIPQYNNDGLLYDMEIYFHLPLEKLMVANPKDMKPFPADGKTLGEVFFNYSRYIEK